MRPRRRQQQRHTPHPQRPGMKNLTLACSLFSLAATSASVVASLPIGGNTTAAATREEGSTENSYSAVVFAGRNKSARDKFFAPMNYKQPQPDRCPGNSPGTVAVPATVSHSVPLSENVLSDLGRQLTDNAIELTTVVEAAAAAASGDKTVVQAIAAHGLRCLLKDLAADEPAKGAKVLPEDWVYRLCLRRGKDHASLLALKRVHNFLSSLGVPGAGREVYIMAYNLLTDPVFGFSSGEMEYPEVDAAAAPGLPWSLSSITETIASRGMAPIKHVAMQVEDTLLSCSKKRLTVSSDAIKFLKDAVAHGLTISFVFKYRYLFKGDARRRMAQILREALPAQLHSACESVCCIGQNGNSILDHPLLKKRLPPLDDQPTKTITGTIATMESKVMELNDLPIVLRMDPEHILFVQRERRAIRNREGRARELTLGERVMKENIPLLLHSNNSALDWGSIFKYYENRPNFAVGQFPTLMQDVAPEMRNKNPCLNFAAPAYIWPSLNKFSAFEEKKNLKPTEVVEDTTYETDEDDDDDDHDHDEEAELIRQVEDKKSVEQKPAKEEVQPEKNTHTMRRISRIMRTLSWSKTPRNLSIKRRVKGAEDALRRADLTGNAIVPLRYYNSVAELNAEIEALFSRALNPEDGAVAAEFAWLYFVGLGLGGVIKSLGHVTPERPLIPATKPGSPISSVDTDAGSLDAPASSLDSEQSPRGNTWKRLGRAISQLPPLLRGKFRGNCSSSDTEDGIPSPRASLRDDDDDEHHYGGATGECAAPRGSLVSSPSSSLVGPSPFGDNFVPLKNVGRKVLSRSSSSVDVDEQSLEWDKFRFTEWLLRSQLRTTVISEVKRRISSEEQKVKVWGAVFDWYLSERTRRPDPFNLDRLLGVLGQFPVHNLGENNKVEAASETAPVVQPAGGVSLAPTPRKTSLTPNASENSNTNRDSLTSAQQPSLSGPTRGTQNNACGTVKPAPTICTPEATENVQKIIRTPVMGTLALTMSRSRNNNNNNHSQDTNNNNNKGGRQTLSSRSSDQQHRFPETLKRRAVLQGESMPKPFQRGLMRSICRRFANW